MYHDLMGEIEGYSGLGVADAKTCVVFTGITTQELPGCLRPKKPQELYITKFKVFNSD